MLEKIFQSSTKGRIAKNFLVLICGNIIAQIFAIFSTVYLARVLGINGFGKIGFAQGIISYFSLLADFGLRTVGIREIAKNKAEIKKYVSHLLTIRLFLAVVSFILLSVLILFLPKPVDYKILIALFGLNIFPLVFLIDWVFQALEKMEFQAIGDGIRALFYLIFVFLFVKGEKNLMLVPIFFAVSYFMAALFLIYIFVRKFGWIKFSFERKIWKHLILSAAPIGVSGFLLLLGNNINIVLLGFLKGDMAVGSYNAANKLITLPIGLGGFFWTAVFPVMVRYYRESKEKLRNFMNQFSKMIIFLTTPMVVGGIILAPEIINLVYGKNYSLSILPFQVLMFYLFFTFISAPFYHLLLAVDKQKYFFYGMAIGATVNFVLNLILIPFYNSVGAALAASISYFIMFIVFYIISCKKIIRVPMIKDFLLSFLISLTMGFLIIRTNFNFIVEFLIGFLFYIFCIIILLLFYKKRLKTT